MTPVFLLTDGYIANGSEPWRVPALSELPKINVKFAKPETAPSDNGHFLPYARDEYLSRPWALPGTPGLMHRLGGLEKANLTGNVSYDPDNHQRMIEIRAEKVANIAQTLAPQEVFGPESGKLLVISWGGTYGACATAVKEVQDAGGSVAHCHLRYLNPFPSNLEEIIGRYEKVLVPELNMGQLKFLLRGTFLIDAFGLNKVQGKPFAVSEVVSAIQELLD